MASLLDVNVLQRKIMNAIGSSTLSDTAKANVAAVFDAARAEQRGDNADMASVLSHQASDRNRAAGIVQTGLGQTGTGSVQSNPVNPVVGNEPRNPTNDPRNDPRFAHTTGLPDVTGNERNSTNDPRGGQPGTGQTVNDPRNPALGNDRPNANADQRNVNDPNADPRNPVSGNERTLTDAEKTKIAADKARAAANPRP